MRVYRDDDGRGRAIAVKEAHGPDEAARLRREADLLDVATHPGLVELVDFVDATDAALRTGWVASSSLADEGPLELDEVAGVVAALASTLADLHALAVVHGAVAPAHVLLDADGRPVLCSLGYGGLAGERAGPAPPLGADMLDPARAEGQPLEPAADVFGLGAVLAFLLDRANGRVRGPAGDALRRVSGRARAPSPADRPGAREVADAVHDAVVGARLPRRGVVGRAAAAAPAASSVRPLEGWRRAQAPAALAPRRRLRSVAVAVGVIAAVGVGVGLVTGRAGGPPSEGAQPGPVAEPPPAVAPVSPVPTTIGVPMTTAPLPPVRRPEARQGCPDVDASLSADVDGDGCAEAVRAVAGVVEAGGLRWSVGDTGDVMAVGDWACSGTRSLAVLRPATGEVFAFRSWAGAGDDLHAPLLGQVAGARALRAADLDADGCNELVVERSSGPAAVLRMPELRP